MTGAKGDVALCPNRGILTRLDSNGSEIWEERLAAEGLGVVEPGSAVSSKARYMAPIEAGAYVAAVERWQAWAERVLATHPWPNAHQRRVWELHAQGTPMRDIPGDVMLNIGLLAGGRGADRRDGKGLSHASVERIIAAVNAVYPDRPRNPWSSPIVQKTRDELLVDYPPPARSLSPEEVSALASAYTPPERKTTVMMKTYKYDLIMFSRRKSIPIPGNQIANDRLLNVEGTPHAGGIDVVLGGKVITISWDSVSHTVRDAEPAAVVK